MKRRRLLPVVLVTAFAAIVQPAASATNDRREPTRSRSEFRALAMGESSGRAAADTCVFFFRDHGDAPEGFPAYPSVTGHSRHAPMVALPARRRSNARAPRARRRGRPGMSCTWWASTWGFPSGWAAERIPRRTTRVTERRRPRRARGPRRARAGRWRWTASRRASRGCRLVRTSAWESDRWSVGSARVRVVRIRHVSVPGHGVSEPILRRVPERPRRLEPGRRLERQRGLCIDVVLCAGVGAEESDGVAPARLSSEHTTPSFRVGPRQGRAWMRVTLTSVPVPETFPWAGSVGTVNGDFAGGETKTTWSRSGPRRWMSRQRPTPWAPRSSLGPIPSTSPARSASS